MDTPNSPISLSYQLKFDVFYEFWLCQVTSSIDQFQQCLIQAMIQSFLHLHKLQFNIQCKSKQTHCVPSTHQVHNSIFYTSTARLNLQEI